MAAVYLPERARARLRVTVVAYCSFGAGATLAEIRSPSGSGLAFDYKCTAGEMMNRATLLILGLLLPLSACAGRVAPEPPQKVDLDDVVTSGVVRPVDGITAAGQPDEAAFKIFAANGYAAVIDLRTQGEPRGLDEQAVVEGLGMEYVHFPINRDGITFENAKSLDKLIDHYNGPVLVHCRSSNRVGALLALRASLAGADDEAALEIGKAGGLKSLEEQVREVLTRD